LAVNALSEMNKTGISPKVFSNHGGVDSSNHDAIGYDLHDFKHGDLPGSPEHHTDISLYPNGPFRFLWQIADAEHYSHLYVNPLHDGNRMYGFSRFYPPPAHLYQIEQQISNSNLDSLIDNQGYMFVANHLGYKTPNPIFDDKNQKALRSLASRYQAGEIYVTTTGKLLWYRFVHNNLDWTQNGNCNSQISININKVSDNIFGDFIPNMEDLQGITFYTDCPSKTRISIDSRDVTKKTITNPQDQTGKLSVSFPLIPLPQLPEWTSSGYTRKTESYTDDFDYTISVTNIGDVAVAPTLNYIGLHDFSIREARAGSDNLRSDADERIVYLPRLQPKETISNIRILNGAVTSQNNGITPPSENSINDLIRVMDTWKNGQVSLQDVMASIVEWKG